jgi:sensor histidine kinase YesM
LATIFEKDNQPTKALEYYKQFHFLNDSLQSIDKVNHIAELEKKFETEQKEHQIGLLSAENLLKNQRIKLGLTVIILLVVALILGVMLHIQRQRNAKALEADLQQKLSRSQMNPHFVSNAMSSIQSFMYNNNPTEAAKYLGKFAQLNRAVLEHSLVDNISLEEEVEMLSNYLEFEQLRLKNSFTFSFEIDKDTDTELINIPPLFIQPFVENAVKHGIKDLDKEGKITIRLTDCNRYLKVEVIDNGKGITTEDTAVNSKHKSRSIEIVSKRLKLLRNKYKDLPNFTIINIDNGVCVTQFLPILPC